MSFYSGCYRSFVPDDLTAFMTYHAAVPSTVPSSAVRSLAPPAYPIGYLRRVDHVGGPTVRGCCSSRYVLIARNCARWRLYTFNSHYGMLLPPSLAQLLPSWTVKRATRSTDEVGGRHAAAQDWWYSVGPDVVGESSLATASNSSGSCLGAVRSRRATRVSWGAVLLLFFGLSGKGEGETEMGVDFAAGLMAMAVVAAAVAGSAAQSPPDCVSNLMGCAGYLNSTTPPDSCCGPLKQTAKSELPCLCALFNNTALLRTFNVNITQAIQMSKRCGVSIDQRACATATASGTSKPLHPPLPSPTLFYLVLNFTFSRGIRCVTRLI
ncbi:hypothetical protein BHM03_00058700 [Ensete ventricosum]|nr:hypothetical protein BHM03_00058700 [Ensete ventricosum]